MATTLIPPAEPAQTEPTQTKPTRPGQAGQVPDPTRRSAKARRARSPEKARVPRPRPAPRDPREGYSTASLLAIGLLLVGGLLAGFAGYLLVGSGLAADRSQNVMYRDLTKKLGLATVPVNGLFETGTPLGIVQIPKLGVDQVFVAGSGSAQTATGPGLRHDSALPGQAGVSVMVGRRAAFGAAFAHLDRLEVGDTIHVITGQGEFDYVVDATYTSDAGASIPPTASRLTLMTSDPPLTPTRTRNVTAHLQGDPLPTATGAAAGASSVPADDAGEGSGRPVALLLWTQLLLLLTAGVTWLALRKPGPALWIGAVPVLLAVLWNVYENLALLLPNTL